MSVLKTIAVCLLSFFSALASTNSQANDNILAVFSYSPKTPHAGPMLRGIEEALHGKGASLDVFFMQTRIGCDPACRQEAGRRARKLLEKGQHRVVIAVDDNAQECFAKDLAGKPGAPQIIFLGVDNDFHEYGYPAENVTGILAKPIFEETIHLLRKICPSIRSVSVVITDSPTGRLVKSGIEKEKPAVPIDSLALVSDFEQWRRWVYERKGKTDAVVVALCHPIPADSSRTRTAYPREIISWTVANLDMPLAALHSHAVKEGALCGIVRDTHMEGLVAGRMALALLHGAKAGDLPIGTPINGNIAFNLKTAERLGILIPYSLIRQAQLVYK